MGKLWPYGQAHVRTVYHSMIMSTISDVAADKIGMDIIVKFGDSILNSGRIIRLIGRPAGHVLQHFCVVFNCILQLTGSS